MHVRTGQGITHVFDDHPTLVVKKYRQLVVLRQQIRASPHNQRPRPISGPAAQDHHALMAGERRGRRRQAPGFPGRPGFRIEQRPGAVTDVFRRAIRQIQHQFLRQQPCLRVAAPEIEALQQRPVRGHHLAFRRRPVTRERVRISIRGDAAARPDQFRVLQTQPDEARVIEGILQPHQRFRRRVILGRSVLAGIVVVQQFRHVLHQRTGEIRVHLGILVVSPVPADDILQKCPKSTARPPDEIGLIRRQPDRQQRPESIQFVILEMREISLTQVVPASLCHHIVFQHSLGDILPDAHTPVAACRRRLIHPVKTGDQVVRLHVHKTLPVDVARLRVHAPHLPLLTLGNIQWTDRRGRQRGQRVVNQQGPFAESGLAGNRIGQGQIQQGVVRGPAGPVRVGTQHTHDIAVPHGHRREPFPFVVEAVSFVAEPGPLPILRIFASAVGTESPPGL